MEWYNIEHSEKKIQNLTEGDYLHSLELIETGSADLSNSIVHTAVISLK